MVILQVFLCCFCDCVVLELYYLIENSFVDLILDVVFIIDENFLDDGDVDAFDCTQCLV